MNYDFDPSDEDTVDTPRETGPFKQLRDHAKKLEKDLKARDKDLEELRQFKASVELARKREVLERSFEAAGLPSKHAELYAAMRPDEDPTVDSVKAFAIEYGFLSAPKADDEEDESGQGFSPAPPSGVPSSRKQYSSEEFDKLYKVNPVEAMKAATEGRVDFIRNR